MSYSVKQTVSVLDCRGSYLELYGQLMISSYFNFLLSNEREGQLLNSRTNNINQLF